MLECLVCAVKQEPGCADQALPHLSEYQFCIAFKRAVLVINLIAVDERNHIGILFDCA